ncbi:MAG: hypothetical protein OXH70_17485 [Acidobacteria bacterium]|nr:hypothetical protein [Acidobacteriota bacterium]
MAMNIERLEKLYEHCSALPHGIYPEDGIDLEVAANQRGGHQDTFNQHIWWQRGMCRTTGCLAGWTVNLFGDDDDFEEAEFYSDDKSGYMHVAQRLLGLDDYTAGSLFLYTGTDEAMATLRHLIEHGEMP